MYSVVNQNNTATAIGVPETLPQFSHSHCDEDFYSFILRVPRLSDMSDFIVITISEKLMRLVPIELGKQIAIDGQFRSYNNYSGSGSKLQLTLFARDIRPAGENEENPNQIYLNGYLCKAPIYRTTPFGREIADILIAVNRSYGKSDYIPCIAWGRNAKFASTLSVGDNIRLWGRMQSREYQKKIDEEHTITKLLLKFPFLNWN